MLDDETSSTKLRNRLADALKRQSELLDQNRVLNDQIQRQQNRIAELSRRFDEGELCLRIEAALRKAVPLPKDVANGPDHYALSFVDVVNEFYRHGELSDLGLKLVNKAYLDHLVAELLKALKEN
jgi:hypothetical protein